MIKLLLGVAWLYREFTGRCHICKQGHMTTEAEHNGDAYILGLPMTAHCTKCGNKRYI